MHCIKAWCLLSLYHALIHRLAFSIPLDAKSNLTVADDLQRTETGFPLSRPQPLDPSIPNRRRQMSYNVPNTQTRLKIFFGRPLDSVILQGVLESVRSFCTFVITHDGDSRLPPDLDPYSCNGPYGGNVRMRSVQNQHLTYRILRSTMQGLLNVLVIGGEDYDVEVEVFNWDWSLVGIGHVSETIRVANLTERRRTEDLVTQSCRREDDVT